MNKKTSKIILFLLIFSLVFRSDMIFAQIATSSASDTSGTESVSSPNLTSHDVTSTDASVDNTINSSGTSQTSEVSNDPTAASADSGGTVIGDVNAGKASETTQLSDPKPGDLSGGMQNPTSTEPVSVDPTSNTSTTSSVTEPTSLPNLADGIIDIASSSQATSSEQNTGSPTNSFDVAPMTSTSSENQSSSSSSSLGSTSPMLDLPSAPTSSEPAILPSIPAGTSTPTTTVPIKATSTDQVDSSATSTILTGDALSLSNLENVVNVNLYDSQALFALLNSFGEKNGSLDLRGSVFGFDGFLGCDSCQVGTSTVASSTSLSASSSAEISNDVNSDANSGINTIGNGGPAIIVTGNSYAGANIFNLANVNLIDSNYMLMIVNSFGKLNGDLVLPNSDFFKSFLAKNINNSYGDLTVDSVNSGIVSNDVELASNTGKNSATSSGESVILTGNSYSASNIINDVNQTHIGDSSISILFRIFGNWSGKTFNMPDGFSVLESGNGYSLISYGGQGGTAFGRLTSSSTNNALIENKVRLNANTGGNNASGTDAYIITGDSYAAANIFNVANTTSISRNWLGAVVNIFGDWNGNLSFGQPDLWAGIKAEVKGKGRGAEVALEYTIMNKGDAIAHDVNLETAFGSNILSYTDANNGKLGDISPGQTVVVNRIAKVTENVPYGDTAVSHTVKLTAPETDSNAKDNSDVITIVIPNPKRSHNDRNTFPDFQIIKTANSTTTIQASTTVEFTVKVTNTGGNASNAALIDMITDSNGKAIHKEQWDLGKVKHNEEITVTYTAFFSSSTAPGEYTNSAWIISLDDQFGETRKSTASVKVAGEPVEEVTYVAPPVIKIKQVKKVETEEATTTELISTEKATSTAVVLTSADGNGSLLANILSALNSLPWYIYLLALILAALIYWNRKRRLSGAL